MPKIQERFVRDRTDRIRSLNDAFRNSLIGGKVMLTCGIVALDGATQRAILTQIAAYDDFDHDNDPYGEHDFGMVEIEGNNVMFKIDYYDLKCEYGSPDPSDPSVTCRVMTIMLAEEY